MSVSETSSASVEKPNLIRETIIYILMAAVAITTVGPFLIMLSVSLTQNIRFITFPIELIPTPMTLENFQTLFARTDALRWLFNSVYVAVISTLGGVITSSMAGYAFARGNFWGKNVIFMLFLGILIMPDTALIVPQFVVLSRLGLVNTYTALIGPWFASIFGTFLLRQAYLSIPRDYDDAATIDGANLWQNWWHVLMPQVVPTMATLAVLRFMGNWNSFFYPMIVTSKSDMRTLTVGLGTVARSGGDAGLDMAGAVLGFLPTLIVFVLMQRYIIRGISLSGVKG
ncbi:MAG: carbohydrate ABC transporter permease [Caldilineaceae bacterium SB0661_bin_32]|uniref:Carbohydrate ABC transporter permease n=1 Tax=Caldilineaceae bacterium SB0661_bin_32 TaxID=2605255 RepID=A0A6B1D2M0_9CHLR|nr:carbohydrate ABC transporter permease [Caldilineaceae bacterium SB0661_bin_32]